MKSRLAMVVALLTGVLCITNAAAQPTFPSSFKSQTITMADGAKIFVRSAGTGPAVVLIHGFGDTGDMWAPLAKELAKSHLVIVPDLRGMGKSSKAASGYDKRSQAVDIRTVVTALKQDKTAVVGHDIGTMVAYAYAASYPDKVDKLVVMDAPVPGIAPWDEIILWPALWHFNAGGPDFERLVAGRERIYLDRFWNEFAGTPSKIDEATRRHYTKLYSQPGAMRAAFAQFNAIAKSDVADNIAFSKTKLAMPVLAIGGEKSFGDNMAVVMRNAATNVRGEVVPGAGHWLMEESTGATVGLIRGFLASSQ